MSFYTTQKNFWNSYIGLFKKKINLVLKLIYGPGLILFKKMFTVLAFMTQKYTFYKTLLYHLYLQDKIQYACHKRPFMIWLLFFFFSWSDSWRYPHIHLLLVFCFSSIKTACRSLNMSCQRAILPEYPLLPTSFYPVFLPFIWVFFFFSFFLFCILFFQLSPHPVWDSDPQPEIKSCILQWLSQPGTPFLLIS